MLGIAIRIALGAALGLALAVPVMKKRIMTFDGVIAAIILSAAIFASGWQSFILIFLFFLLSSLLTKYNYKKKKMKGAAERENGRDWRQVMGAGLIAELFSILSVASNEIHEPLITAMATSIAVSNADTWAVELGSLSKGRPRLIHKPWIRVPPGTSGGVTLRGEIASLAGALFISLTYYVLRSLHPLMPFLSWNLKGPCNCCALVVFILGWLGELLDSIIGGTLQEKFLCVKCGEFSDKEIHLCSEKTVRAGGIRHFTNEATNLLSTSIVAIAAFIISASLRA